MEQLLMPAHEPAAVPEQVRFSREELEGILLDVRASDLKKMHPEDQKVFQELYMSKFLPMPGAGMKITGKLTGPAPLKALMKTVGGALGIGGGAKVASKGGKPPLERIPAAKSGSDIAERVTQGGVQNDFRGRVSLPKYPKNVNTQAGYGDVAEQVLHQKPGVPTPVKFHMEDGPEMRRAIELLKRMSQSYSDPKKGAKVVQRRSPK